MRSPTPGPRAPWQSSSLQIPTIFRRVDSNERLCLRPARKTLRECARRRESSANSPQIQQPAETARIAATEPTASPSRPELVLSACQAPCTALAPLRYSQARLVCRCRKQEGITVRGSSSAADCQDRLKTSLPGNDSDICLGDYSAAGSARGIASGTRGPSPRRLSLRRYMMFCLSEITVAA
jgi:hypothetical protein